MHTCAIPDALYMLEDRTCPLQLHQQHQAARQQRQQQQQRSMSSSTVDIIAGTIPGWSGVKHWFIWQHVAMIYVLNCDQCQETCAKTHVLRHVLYTWTGWFGNKFVGFMIERRTTKSLRRHNEKSWPLRLNTRLFDNRSADPAFANSPTPVHEISHSYYPPLEVGD